jgi:uncharacterized protein
MSALARKASLSISEARRIALAAQQFVPASRPPRNAAGLVDLVRRLGVVQMDSVNVLVRSHYLPVFSRRGAYAQDLLEQAAYCEGPRHLFEYWGHEASLLPIEAHPLFRWRMEDARNGQGTWKRLQRYALEHRAQVASALAQIRERGALGASELTDGGRSKGSWWGWSEGKEILEWLFWTGEVTTARRRNFERLYDLTERIIPADLRERTVSREDAQRQLMRTAAAAMGIATARDLRDYFRLPASDASARVRDLVDDGTLRPVTVEGWKQQAFIYSQARCPREVDVAALLSPFDSLIWERQRTERLFGFHYRLEIYTPAHKRQHGYYVLPFLMGEQLVARVDLKSDRKRGRLQVKGATLEEGARAERVAVALDERLTGLANWLGLEDYELCSRRGELMRALKRRQARP